MDGMLLHDADGLRTYAVAMGPGDEAADALQHFAEEAGITAAGLTGVGAFSRATVGWFDLEEKDYRRIEVDEQVEVLSLAGNVARTGSGETKVHVHLVLGRSDGSTVGGHLLAGDVQPTLEVMVTESPARLQRTIDPATGLPLLPRGV